MIRHLTEVVHFCFSLLKAEKTGLILFPWNFWLDSQSQFLIFNPDIFFSITICRYLDNLKSSRYRNQIKKSYRDIRYYRVIAWAYNCTYDLVVLTGRHVHYFYLIITETLVCWHYSNLFTGQCKWSSMHSVCTYPLLNDKGFSIQRKEWRTSADRFDRQDPQNDQSCQQYSSANVNIHWFRAKKKSPVSGLCTHRLGPTHRHF